MRREAKDLTGWMAVLSQGFSILVGASDGAQCQAVAELAVSYSSRALLPCPSNLSTFAFPNPKLPMAKAAAAASYLAGTNWPLPLLQPWLTPSSALLSLPDGLCTKPHSLGSPVQ